jgi:serine/threonine protein phosphatase PrpC
VVGGADTDPAVGLDADTTSEAPTDGAGPSATCAVCGADLVAGAKFCEACGDDLTTDADDAASAAAFGAGAAPASGEAAGNGAAGPEAGPPTLDIDTPDLDAGGDPPCTRCGGDVGEDGYCMSCGHRALEPVTVDDRGPTAYAGHRGRRHHRNEDSCALGLTAEGWPVLVVSDGVSVSPNPHKASAAAVTAATRRLAGAAFGGPDDLAAAVADAHAAACGIEAEGDPSYPPDGTHPACTIVVAVATSEAVHVANVGDARAHLLTPAAGGGWGATQLSTDDSVAAHAVAQGIDVDVALALPGGHGITAWLGSDAPEPHPHLASHAAAPGDVLLAASDGLWNYAATDEAMGALASRELAAPGDVAAEPLGAPCERMAAWAVGQGGADNVTVALAPVPSAGPTEPAASGVLTSGAGAAAGATPATTDPDELEENP